MYFFFFFFFLFFCLVQSIPLLIEQQQQLQQQYNQSFPSKVPLLVLSHINTWNSSFLFINLTISEQDKNVLYMIDTTHGNTFSICCNSPLFQSQSNCSDQCSSFSCYFTDRDCLYKQLKYSYYRSLPFYNGIRYWNTYVQNKNPTNAPLFSFDQGNTSLNTMNQTIPKVFMTDLNQYDTNIEDDVPFQFTNSSFKGILGIGYSKNYLSFHSYIYEFFSGIVALDLQYMYFGKENIPNYDQFIWSEKQYRLNSIFYQAFINQKVGGIDLGHRFSLYDLNLNHEIPLLFNYSSYWQGQINTRIEGIAFPEPFYRMIQQWKQENNTSIFLEFSLHSSSPQKIQLPLYNIKLYMSSAQSMVGRVGLSRTEPVIEFGIQCLEYFRIAMDMVQGRVGFYPLLQQSITNNNNSILTQKKQCIGQQSYYLPMNECIDPPCYWYYLQRVDEQTKTCGTSYEFFILLLAVLFVFVTSEIVLMEVYQRVVKQIPS